MAETCRPLWLGEVTMSGDDALTMPVARRIEVFTGAGRRRRWCAESKARIVAESYATSVGETADRYALSKTQIFTWRRDARRLGGDALGFTPVVVEDRSASPGGADGGLIEVELGAARLRIARGADADMALAVLRVLRGGR
jgi:transposase